jgi:hypothetical protein
VMKALTYKLYFKISTTAIKKALFNKAFFMAVLSN